MPENNRSQFARQFRDMSAVFGRGWQLLKHRGPSQVQFWFIALMIGIAAGLAAVVFRSAIEWLQSALYGTDDINLLHSFAGELHWFWILIIPMAGGIAVGIILHLFTPDGRVQSVADVIEGAALNDGRVEKRRGSRRRSVPGSRCPPVAPRGAKGRSCISRR